MLWWKRVRTIAVVPPQDDVDSLGTAWTTFRVVSDRAAAHAVLFLYGSAADEDALRRVVREKSAAAAPVAVIYAGDLPTGVASTGERTSRVALRGDVRPVGFFTTLAAATAWLDDNVKSFT